MKFNEDSRVKIPSLLHLTRLGYTYLSLKDTTWNKQTNIFSNIFIDSIMRINDIEENEAKRVLDNLSLLLENSDLGKAFYSKLVDKSGIRVIDFENFDNNSFHVVTELPYQNGDSRFRPDITLLINGLPLIFIEVKKPNNPNGILAEKERIEKRFSNKKFRRFANITQIMIFSNNMEYDDTTSKTFQGAFYATSSYSKPIFNYFREEEKFDLDKILAPENDEVENFILKDNNLTIIKHSPEFLTNKSHNTPTNRISTSILSRKRLAFMLEYGIAYVKKGGKIQKHIMRYPQLFATKAIARSLENGIKKGIIWHTQGSGKTALSFFNVKYLTQFFQKKSTIPKFYFIVDRLDLLIQAQREFKARGLIVHTVNSKEEFATDLKKQRAISNDRGESEITVVNIQKFKDNGEVIKESRYNTNIQSVFFLDEVHRSYNPKGSFLANLMSADINAIKIGLTGTPFLGKDYNSKTLFGDYIHKYYYDASIADGYTLRLIREEIETSYKIVLEEKIKSIEVLKGSIDRKDLYANEQFVKPMLEYILDDFKKSRRVLNDNSIGGMVICHSSKQAKMMYKLFNEMENRTIKRAELILHDVGDNETKKEWINEFKAGEVDLLFVYNMLLTGFDAPRLKKLYLGRVLKSHNLLQALTRVNRTYKDFKYGYVVDFADISREFKATNEAYFRELTQELGDEVKNYSQLFKSESEIVDEIEEIKDTLWEFDTQNAENFSKQISKISNIKEMRKLKKVLENSKNIYNLIRLFGYEELLDKLEFKKLNRLYIEVSNRLNLLNLKEKSENSSDSSNIINEALEDTIFLFDKIGEEELLLADRLKRKLRKTREEFISNFDKKDPEYIKLKSELERLFKKGKIGEIGQEAMEKNIAILNKILEKIRELNQKNERLSAKYGGDNKYVRVHKRFAEKNILSKPQNRLFQALKGIKEVVDNDILKNSKLLDNENYFEKNMLRLIIQELKRKQKIKLDTISSKYINNLVVREYINEYNGTEI